MKTSSHVKPLRGRDTFTSQEDTGRNSRHFKRLLRLMSRESGRAICFLFPAERDSKVYVAGTFNNWDPTMHPLDHHPEDSVFKAALLLPAGVHEYKFVVNGKWHLDARCPHSVPNSLGTLNSVVRV